MGSQKEVPLLARKELDQLYQLKLDKGIRNVPILSFLLIRESEQARRKGDSDQAVRMATVFHKILTRSTPALF